MIAEWIAEAPALEEALRAAGFGRDEADVFHNPAFDSESKRGSHDGSHSKLGIVQFAEARRVEVRPKRSSFAAAAHAGRQAQKSIFQSAAKTATLTAGMVGQTKLSVCVSSCTCLTMS